MTCSFGAMRFNMLFRSNPVHWIMERTMDDGAPLSRSSRSQPNSERGVQLPGPQAIHYAGKRSSGSSTALKGARGRSGLALPVGDTDLEIQNALSARHHPLLLESSRGSATLNASPDAIRATICVPGKRYVGKCAEHGDHHSEDGTSTSRSIFEEEIAPDYARSRLPRQRPTLEVAGTTYDRNAIAKNC